MTPYSQQPIVFVRPTLESLAAPVGRKITLNPDICEGILENSTVVLYWRPLATCFSLLFTPSLRSFGQEVLQTDFKALQRFALSGVPRGAWSKIVSLLFSQILRLNLAVSL